MRARSNFRSNRSHLWNQPRLHPLTPIYLCRPSPTCRKTATISPPNPAHPASLTTPEAASCEIALRTNRRSTATASTLASRRPKVPAMPYRKSYTCPTSSTPTSQGPTRPAPAASPPGLSSDASRWQKSERRSPPRPHALGGSSTGNDTHEPTVGSCNTRRKE
jgi:hypothetical protein